MKFVQYLFDISADGGNTWTTQWLTENEAAEIKNDFPAWIVKRKNKTDFQVFYV